MSDVKRRVDGDEFVIAGRALASRLLMGSAGYPNQRALLDAIDAGQPGMVTVSIRRASRESYAGSLLEVLGPRAAILPNTAGCATVRDAVLTAELAREALETDWVKLDRAALLHRRSPALPAPRRQRRRRRHAAGIADRLRPGHPQPLQHRDDLRAQSRAGHPRRRHRHRLRRGAGPGAGLRRRPRQHRHRQSPGPGSDGAGNARRGGRRPRRLPRRPHPPAPACGGLESAAGIGGVVGAAGLSERQRLPPLYPLGWRGLG